jgi:hypothetical protein
MNIDRFLRPAGPSVPASQSDDFKHSEQIDKPAEDVMPEGDDRLLTQDGDGAARFASRAVLRLKIEQLLQRREAAPIEQWQALGPDGLEMLVSLLDDPGIGDDVRHAVIATLGNLEQPLLADRLGPMLLDRSESALTRTYAASALGRLGGDRAVTWLGRASGDPDEMVRLQLARGLRRAGGPLAVAYLRSLSRDREGVVADEAKAALGAPHAGPDATYRGAEPAMPGREIADGDSGHRPRSGLILILLALALLLLGGCLLWLLGRLPA